MRERFIDEFFEVNTELGHIYAKKNRAGSPIRAGQRIFGTKRNGVTYIRTQHTASGATISVPLRDIIWWKATGAWPERALKYRGASCSVHACTIHHNVDRINNLELTPDKPGPRYPFVSQYKPKGRENNQNYGKHIYQRRHMFKLVRVGYWDTEEEAATEGLKAWKTKVRG